MKLQPYQLCRWCDAASHGKQKWLWLAVNALTLLLSVAFGLAWLTLPLLLALNAVLALYLLHRHHAFGAAYQRKPRPMEALCETVLIDADLIGQGTRLRAAAQPIDVAEVLSMRLGSGVLLLGAAMTLTADTLPPADRAALLSAVHTLNIKPSRMRSHNPVLRQETLDNGVTAVTVRDGMSERRYYAGSPMDVARLCASIWEGHTRPLTDHDHARIEDTARYIAQGSCRVIAWATALAEETPIFLGMAGFGEDVQLAALQDVADLRSMGLTVMLNTPSDTDADRNSLLTLLELPDHHARADLHLTSGQPAIGSALGITRTPGDSLLEPVHLLRQRFRIIEDTLRLFALLLAVTLVTALLSGSMLTSLLLTGLLLCAAIVIGVDLTAPRLRWFTLLTVCGMAVLAKGFLSAQPEALRVTAGSLVAVVTAGCMVLRLCGQGYRLKGEGRQPSLILTGAVLVTGVAFLIYGLLQGTAALLPLGFGLLISAIIAILVLWEHKILR